MVGRKDDEWPPGNGSPKTGSSTVMALDPSSAKPRSLGATFLPNAVLHSRRRVAQRLPDRLTLKVPRLYICNKGNILCRCIYVPT